MQGRRESGQREREKGREGERERERERVGESMTLDARGKKEGGKER